MVSFDSAICRFDISRFKGRLADYQSVDDDSQRPDVDFIRMARPSFQDLRCDVVWRTANSSLFLPVEIEFCGKTEVSKFDLHFLVDEKIAQLQVSVDDAVRV